jgi:hypothetical protein
MYLVLQAVICILAAPGESNMAEVNSEYPLFRDIRCKKRSTGLDIGKKS